MLQGFVYFANFLLLCIVGKQLECYFAAYNVLIVCLSGCNSWV